MRLIRLLALAALASVSLARPDFARADWPPAATDTVAQLSQPVDWPNDPSYGIFSSSDEGQWELWSWMPSANQMLPMFHAPEVPMGTGNHVDQAWQVTIGDPHVLIAVIDSGIEWDNTDLITKAAINPGELPQPHDSTGATVAYDANGDGVFNVEDYLGDARIPCGTALPHNLMGCVGSDGMPNDPNHNGVFDAEDLLLTFSNGTDDDHNGYVDDVSGWDFFKDDNDPYDDTRYGHGTGEARDSTAATNNGIGSAGVCPRCMFVPTRAGDSFIAEGNDFAQAVVYATDLSYGGNHVHVIQEALGTLNSTAFARAAIDYAYAHDRVIIASAADENSRHHNLPSTNNHTVVVHANTFNNSTMQTSTTFLAFNNCTNYGGQLQLSVAAASCSSQATGLSSGIAGLIHSEGLATALMPALSAEEVRQLMVETVDDINVPESQPTNPMYDSSLYPSLPGWDQRFGYGRTNAGRAVRWVRDGMIPPEVDITGPTWFRVMFADRDPTRSVTITGRVAARRAPSFDYAVEWARGIEPAPTDWQTIRSETNVTAPVTDTLATLDLTTLQVQNPGEVENEYSITFRVRATAHYGGSIGDVPGEARRVVAVVRDPDLLSGYPVDAGGSVEGSPRLVDLDGDGRREMVIVSTSGVIHALEPDGTDAAGFPTHTNLDRGFQSAGTPSYRGSPAYSGTSPAIDPNTLYEAVLSTPGVADIDNDPAHSLEIVVLGYHGGIYVFNHDGTPYGHGFPRMLPDVPSSATDPNHILDRNIFGPPVLVDLNNDGTLEIVFGAGDGNVWAVDPTTAADVPGFPVQVHFPAMGQQYNRVFGAVGVGHIDSDNIPDLVSVSNERVGGDGNSGAIYVIHGDGNNHAGGPYHPNWPIALPSIYLFPVVGSGTPSAPAIGDIDGDGLDEIALTGTGNPTMAIAHGVQPAHPMLPDIAHDLANVVTPSASQRGRYSNATSVIPTFINVFSMGTFGDMTGDGIPDFVISGAGFDLAINLAGGGRRRDFEHYIGAWQLPTGAALPGFPRVIEDYTFFMNSSIADVSGDGYSEVVIGTGGYFVRAVDACGREAPGFPKFTGQWITSSPAIADVDGDGTLEVATATRAGYIYAWHTRGRSNGSIQWPTFRHDLRNTGNFDTPLEFGTHAANPAGPIVCPSPPVPDAGTVADTGPDAGQPRAVGGCGCRVSGGAPPDRTVYLACFGALAVVLARRRRPRRRS